MMPFLHNMNENVKTLSNLNRLKLKSIKFALGLRNSNSFWDHEKTKMKSLLDKVRLTFLFLLVFLLIDKENLQIYDTD